MMKVKDELLQEVLNRIEKKYGNLDNPCGCSVSTEYGYEWFSVSKIVDIIVEVDEDYN